MLTRPPKACPACDAEFTGRKNQRFCSTACRIRYNNSKIRDAREHISDINKLLYRNRTVLRELHERFDNRSIDKDVLNHSDYNKRYYTHHSYNQNNELYTWCYDYGWIIVDEQHIQVVKSKS